MRLFHLRFIKIRQEVVLPAYVLRTNFYVYRYAYLLLRDWMSTLNRLFGCVFLVLCHHLRKLNKLSVRTFKRFFLQFSYFLMLINIQKDLIILKTYDQQFYFNNQRRIAYHLQTSMMPTSSL